MYSNFSFMSQVLLKAPAIGAVGGAIKGATSSGEEVIDPVTGQKTNKQVGILGRAGRVVGNTVGGAALGGLTKAGGMRLRDTLRQSKGAVQDASQAIKSTYPEPTVKQKVRQVSKESKPPVAQAQPQDDIDAVLSDIFDKNIAGEFLL